MAIEVKIPQISEGVESAEVIEILVSEGDSIEKDQSIIAVETDKASVEVPSSDAGKVKEIKVKEGDEVKVGDVILILEEEDGNDEEEEDDKDEKGEEAEGKDQEDDQKKDKKDDDDQREDDEDDDEAEDADDEEDEDDEDEDDQKEEKEKSDDEVKEEKEGKKKSKGKKSSDDDDKEDGKEEKDEDKPQGKKEKKSDQDDLADIPASPSVRRLAREIGVNIANIEGSGSGGRITEEDVKSQSKNKDSGSTQEEQESLPDFSKWGLVEREKLSGIRKATAKHTTYSWQQIPHVFQFDEADISGIEEYMLKNKEKVEKAGGKLTITAILVKIMASALQQFPQFNASIDLENEEVILKKYFHIGIAVDTEKGLLVPVIRDVDHKTIDQLAVEITELAQKARDQKLSPEDMQGGNISISNLGGIGGTGFTPIISHPQVAILGVSRTKTQPVFVDGNFVPKQILPLSLSYDHRLIDGADGAKFLKWICQALEDPYKALLGA